MIFIFDKSLFGGVQITCDKIGQLISTVGQSEVVFVLHRESQVTQMTLYGQCHVHRTVYVKSSDCFQRTGRLAGNICIVCDAQ